MSKPLFLSSGYVLISGLALLAPTGSSSAQAVARMTEQIESARLRQNAAIAELKVRRQIADLRPSATDTVHFANGNAVILVESEILPVVKIAAANADSILQATAGSSVALLRGVKFTVVTDTSRQHAMGHFANVAYHPSRGGSINRFTPVDASKIAGELLMFATNALL